MAQNFKKDQRKKQIKEVAIKLMSERSYKDISVQEILDELHYSKSGFYHCYESKVELFMDILRDGMEYRYQSIRNTQKALVDMERKDVLIELMLDKILDYNKYKKLYTELIMEMPNDRELLSLYNKAVEDFNPDFLKFCDVNGFTEFKSLVNEEFGIFISTLIVGTEIFNLYNNEKYRKLLREIFTAYFECKAE